MKDFSKEEKISAFNRIADLYYNNNFGSAIKSDIDLLMFSIFLDHCYEAGEPVDDYSVSNQLGISQSRVRALKQNEVLRLDSSRKDNWKAEFAECAKNARYDSTKMLVKLTIPEVVVITELRHFIVENGLYDEYQLNPRLFQCRLDVFVELCGLLEKEDIVFDSDKLKELQAKELKKDEDSAINLIRKGDWKEGLLRIAKSSSKELLPEILKALPVSGTALKLFESLYNTVIKA